MVPASAQAQQSAPLTKALQVQNDATPATTTVVVTSASDAYRPLGDKIAKLVAKDRPKAVEILASFGVTKGPHLKPDQWFDCEAKINAALLA